MGSKWAGARSLTAKPPVPVPRSALVVRPVPLILGALLASPAVGQTFDLVPAYHPHGPIVEGTGGGDRIEFHAAEPFRLEVSLPGLTHAASVGTPGWATWLLSATAQLVTPLTVGLSADLWLDPATLLVTPLPPGLEVEATLAPGPGGLAVEVPTQVAALDLNTAGAPLYLSDPVTAVLLPPAPTFTDRTVPLAAQLGGTESVWFEPASNTYHLRHQLGGVTTEYLLDLDDEDLSKGTLSMTEAASGLKVLDGGGVHYAQGFGQAIYSPPAFQDLGTHTLTGHGISGNTVWMDWTDTLPTFGGGGTVERKRRHEFTLEGRAVQVRVFAVDPEPGAPDNYFAFNLGGYAKADGSDFLSQEAQRIPYMDQVGVTLLDDTWFHTNVIDLFRSNAGLHTPAQQGPTPGGKRYTEVMTYPRQTDFTVVPLDETGWTVVSRDVEDLFVTSTAPPSPHAADLRGKVGITLAREASGGQAYADDLANLFRMNQWMFDEVYLFKFHWMRENTNRRAPTHSPPDLDGGTEAEFRQIISDAASYGWLVALYTDFFSLDQAQGKDDNPHYSETPGGEVFFEAGVKDTDGNYRKGYLINEEVGVPGSPTYSTRILAPRRAGLQLEREAQVMVDDYGVSAAYFDVMTITAPDLLATSLGANIGGVISQDVTSPSDRTIGGAIASYKGLFRQGSQRTGGPAVGEGSFLNFESRFDTLYMGYLDGTYRTLSTDDPILGISYFGESAPLIVDYELRVAHDRMFGFGMGQYARFFDPSQATGQSLPDNALDRLRATQIAYGHNGYFLTASTQTQNTDYLTRAQRVKEYYTMQSLSDEWAGATPTSIRYRAGAAGSPWLELSDAIRADFDFQQPVIHVVWSSGLEVVVNRSGVTVTELGQTVPDDGWVAENATNGYLNHNVIDPVLGTRVQRVVCADYELADGNGVAYAAGGAVGTTTDLTVVNFIHGKTLTELPSGTIQVQ